MTITCGSLFSGIGGFEEGFRRAGIETLWSCEKDKAARAVLSKRFPNAIMLDDVCTADPSKLPKVDIVCGGFPCQDLSVAGKRAGLAGARSGLFYEAMRIVRGVGPKIVILENVPGLLSSNRGLDFAAVLREVGEGWDCEEVAWRVLDSQYFGVAQRRKRVFVVASSRAGCAEEILALAEGVCRNPPSRDKTRQDTSSNTSKCFAGNSASAIAAPLETTANDYSRADGFNMIVGTIDCHIPKQRVQNFCAGHWIAIPIQDGREIDKTQNGIGIGAQGAPSYTIDRTGAQAVAIQGNLIGRDAGGPCGIGASSDETMYTLTKTDVHAVAFRKSKRAQTEDDHETWIDDGLANTLNGFDTGDTRTTHAIAFHPTQDPISSTETSHALGCGSRQGCATVAAAIPINTLAATGRPDSKNDSRMTIGIGSDGDPQFTISSSHHHAVCTSTIVRRLTPVECERLQGFPDGWTDIGTPQKPTADSHRYKQLGNAVTVNVAEWIGKRIATELRKQ